MEWVQVFTIIGSVGSIFAWFWSRLDKRFDKIDKRFDQIDKRFEQNNDQIDRRFEQINDQIREIRTSLNRMEGAFYSKECCMLKDEKKQKGE